MARGVEVVDPPEEIPSGEEFLCQLPEWARQAEEMAFIVDIFNHAAPGARTPFRSLCECRHPS